MTFLLNVNHEFRDENVIIPDEVVIPVHPADILGYHPLADLQWKRNVIYFIELVMNYTVK